MKDIGFGIRLSREEFRRLEALSQRTGRGKGELVRALIRMASARDDSNLQLLRQECQNTEDAYAIR